jgi:hypothetical protein
MSPITFSAVLAAAGFGGLLAEVLKLLAIR